MMHGPIRIRCLKCLTDMNCLRSLIYDVFVCTIMQYLMRYEYPRDDVYERIWRDESISSASVLAFACSLRRRIKSHSQESLWCVEVRTATPTRAIVNTTGSRDISEMAQSFLSILTLLSVACNSFQGRRRRNPTRKRLAEVQ